MPAERYAVYYVPPKDSALAKFGQEWLGIDIETGASVKHVKPHGYGPLARKVSGTGGRMLRA